MQPEHPSSGKLKFDGTINWPFVLTLFTVILGAAGFFNTLIGQIGDVQITLQQQKVSADEQTKEVKGLKESMDNIRLDMAKQDGMRSMVSDHEVRLRALEQKQ